MKKKELVGEKRLKELEAEEIAKREWKLGAEERNRKWKKKYNKMYRELHRNTIRGYDWMND